MVQGKGNPQSFGAQLKTVIKARPYPTYRLLKTNDDALLQGSCLFGVAVALRIVAGQ